MAEPAVRHSVSMLNIFSRDTSMGVNHGGLGGPDP